MNLIDPLQLQRLADGQLDLPAIKQLLADAQSNPQHWQMIASTMIEQQLLERSFQEDTDAPDDVMETSFEMAPAGHLNRLDSSHSSTGSGSRLWNWFAVAAGIMIAGLVGYLAGDSGDLGSAGTNIVSSSTDLAAAVVASPNSQPRTPAVYQPDYHLEIPANSQWAKSRELSPTGRVPLYSVGNQEQLKQFRRHQKATEEFDPEMLRRLAAAGYQIKNDVELISGDLNDGEKFIVPVRTIRLIPGQ
jgi:hypothetical protein